MRFFTACAGIMMMLAALAARAAVPVFDHPVTPAQLRQIIAAAEQELAQHPVLRGHFTQLKYLQYIPKPLRSSGDFIVSREQGIWWHTLTPFDSEFILTPTQMLQVDSGKVAVRMDVAQQPGLKVVGDVFFSIFSLNPSALDKNFELFGMPAEKGWVMGLKPRSSALSNVLTQAVIHGDRRVSKVEMLDGHGDRTEISLDSLGGPAALSDAEATLFKR
ncbi:MAG: outer membrane lipoprotein carrier protein LolA [Stenotrophobium sp.]